MRLPTLPRFLRLRPRTLLFTFAILAALFIAFANYLILTQNADRLFTRETDTPTRDVALVLGASPKLSDGRVNLHFESRIAAAASLYHAGKVRHLLVSGDNGRTSYNEPHAMRDALIARGVPAEAITCDYAGFRTLDSVIRAHRIFGAQKLTIVTQRYHNTRALAIARHEGIDAIGFCSANVNLRDSLRTELREVLARAATILDLHILHRGPKFLGRPEPILASR
jgi:SanA protein